MTAEALTSAVERASRDTAFRSLLEQQPDIALRDYELTDDERAALLSGDSAHLESLGVDARITKQAVYIDPASPGSFSSSING